MLYVGVDLHKHSISLCVVELAGRERKIIERRRFRCDEEEPMADYFAGLGEYQLVVEATASYEWFVQLVEPSADRVLLAHPSHLRVIAQSKRKTDKLDAQTLAEFLALDQIPESWRPTPRVRQHRTLVRHRSYVQKRITSVKNKLRRVLSNYNADQSNLFTKAGRDYLASILVETAWRLVNKTNRWGSLYEKLKARCGTKKAIVAIARRVWCVMVAMLKRGEKYQAAGATFAT